MSRKVRAFIYILFHSPLFIYLFNSEYLKDGWYKILVVISLSVFILFRLLEKKNEENNIKYNISKKLMLINFERLLIGLVLLLSCLEKFYENYNSLFVGYLFLLSIHYISLFRIRKR